MENEFLLIRGNPWLPDEAWGENIPATGRLELSKLLAD